MFNVYLRDKLASERSRRLSHEKLLRKNEMNRDILTLKYKDRINKNLIRLNQDAKGLQRPERVVTPDNLRRSCLKSTGFMSELERVEEAENRNKWLDTTPAQKSVFKLRPRDKDKEIQRDIKVNLKSEKERIEESIVKQKAIFDSSEPPASAKKGHYKNYMGTEKYRFSGGKEVMDYYHFKTYFKTIESLALDIHGSVRNMTKAQIQKFYNDEKLGMNEGGKPKKQTLGKDFLCKEEVIPLSGELMEKYGFWKCRQPFMKKDTSRCGSIGTNRFRAKSTVPFD